jgi:hypothetical protein
MATTLDSSDQLNHIDDQDNDTVPIMPSDDFIPEKKIDEPVTASELEETDITTDGTIDEIPETDGTQSTINSMNMITAEASFTEATSADLPLGTPRSSIARILVKPGQIFRVQVDNEVKEVHGKLVFINSIRKKQHYLFESLFI